MSKDFNIQIASIKDKVFRFARKILDSHEDAQDVVQDLFVKLWQMRSELSRYDSLEAFSIRVTRNMCLDKLRHEKQKTQKLQVVYKNQTTADYTDHFEHKDASDIVKNMIQELPEKQRMIIHLRDVEEMDYEEIAEIMEIEINAVRVNLSRARKTIKEKLIKTMNYGLQRG